MSAFVKDSENSPEKLGYTEAKKTSRGKQRRTSAAGGCFRTSSGPQMAPRCLHDAYGRAVAPLAPLRHHAVLGAGHEAGLGTRGRFLWVTQAAVHGVTRRSFSVLPHTPAISGGVYHSQHHAVPPPTPTRMGGADMEGEDSPDFAALHALPTARRRVHHVDGARRPWLWCPSVLTALAVTGHCLIHLGTDTRGAVRMPPGPGHTPMCTRKKDTEADMGSRFLGDVHSTDCRWYKAKTPVGHLQV